MNQLIVSGRVAKEISVKGKVGYFSLANDRDYPFNKDQNGNKVSNFLTCKVLGEKNIERVQKHLTKGTAIIVTGHYFRDSWKADNDYKEFNYILVEKWEFQQGKGNAEEEQPSASDTPSQPQESQPQEHATNPNDFIDVPEDLESELPFR